jgi:PDZ domain
MRPKLILILLAATGLLAAMIALFQPAHRPALRQAQIASTTNSPDINLPAAGVERAPMPSEWRAISKPVIRVEPAGALPAGKLERLARIREKFHALAAGRPDIAMRTAKQIMDETERETALMTLVTEWTYGNLRLPRDRAEDISRFGIEAGLGMELAGNPELALAWADELTDGFGRQALLTRAATELVGSDPAAAFAMGDQLTDDQKTNFFKGVFANWGGKDTEAALQWANQLPDPDRDAAIQAIRTQAPVGIGTSLTIRDGYPTIMQLIPGTPAELSGQLHEGDRILALAQGDNSFTTAQGIPLADLVKMIRGMPGTALQLQVVSADAPDGTPPQTISLVRDQLKFKR